MKTTKLRKKYDRKLDELAAAILEVERLHVGKKSIKEALASAAELARRVS